MLRPAEIVKKYSLFGEKALGQNFLLGEDLLDRIANSAGNLADADILEVGPGPGSLTLAILEKNPRRLVAIELDRQLAKILEREIGPFFSNLEVFPGNALKINENELFQSKFKILANLPYNIGTSLLLKWLKNSIHRIDSMTLLFQREVADRITATPRTREYGHLSVICQYLCDVEKHFDVPAEAFLPPPRVMSSLISLRPRKDTDLTILPKLIALVGILFSKKRKTILNNLKDAVEAPLETLSKCQINPDSRAEELSVSDILNLLTFLEKNGMDWQLPLPPNSNFKQTIGQ
ncbi:MAG: 16S rRNA (adenine(1518)-N(6)/adenine(1519)-N(6))-dimethyltransferase RsmA [Rickettsiales bacterium]|jgi:16S rRNA (adenine1518-N6/adenine1519-N6)-dimethyltransferase|nr:16S rRNA (adenine(1518)-N(6)/adenine(1519)-N(6))-dimethyltransferase RsmA [Rickettsiales bacterium]